MQRSTAALMGLGLVAALLGVILMSHSGPKKRPHPTLAKPVASAVSSARPAASGAPGPGQDGGAAEDAAAPPFTEGFETFPDGGRVPELPAAAPSEVSFGVVQFSYQGAQFAPADSRNKQQAKDRAESVLELAKRDFAAAVSKGDRGSTADAGRIPRGVLEPPIEYVLFMLDKGTVSPALVDTPRGYWILRRNN